VYVAPRNFKHPKSIYFASLIIISSSVPDYSFDML
jgi:hypothetical protein